MGAYDLDESLLPFVQAASIQSKVVLGAESGRPIPRLLDPAVAARSTRTFVPPLDELVAESGGYSLHAATRIEADDRDRLERLVRYVARPAPAQGRLEVCGDGKVRPHCGGPRHRIATITDPLVVRKILAHFGLRSEPPALAPARPPPQMRLA